MSTVVPILGAGEVTYTEEITRLWVSRCSVMILAAPDVIPPSRSCLEITGEGFSPAFGFDEITGEFTSPARSSVDDGNIPDNIGFGAGDIGSYSPFNYSLGSAETTGEGFNPVLGFIIIGASPSIIGSLIYLSMAGLEIVSESASQSRASYQSRAELVGRSIAAEAVRLSIEEPSRSTLEDGTKSALPVRSSLDDGLFLNNSSRLSADVEDGESVEFIIDIQDEILHSGHGDC